jgi:Leucine-rich repeat (LRR) protein
MKNYVFISLMSILFFNIISSCKKDDLPVIINAGNDIINVDNFCVTLNADSLSSGETGEWIIKTGLVDENVYFENSKSPNTKFHGLPGQKYVLVWKVLNKDKNYEDSITVIFKPIIVNISTEGADKYSTRIRLKTDATFPGMWTITGNIEKVRSLLGGEVYAEKTPYVEIYGKENDAINAKWTITYGSVSFSDSITFKTGSYNEYEALEDLQLTSENPGGRYVMENGHVVELNLGADGRGSVLLRLNENPSLKALKYLQRIDLQGDLLNSFPEVITSYYKDLTYLNMSGNYLNQIPADIGNLAKLETLYYNNQQDYNVITSLPESFCDLVNLKFLELSSNNISVLPTNFGNLIKLESFYLWGSLLDSLPVSFGNLISLKYCYVFTKTSLPESFSQLINMVDLNTGGQAEATRLPENIGNLKKMKSFVYQGDNNIEKLPDSICELDSLSVLVISSKLKELPANIGNLKSLQQFDLRSNIAELPPSFTDLSNLKSFTLRSSLENGPVFNLPEDIGKLTNLEGIMIQFTNIYSLPDGISSLSNLKGIYVQWCKLQNVPSSIGDLRNLSDIFLNNNELSVIPDNFKNLNLGNRINRISLEGNVNLAWQIDEIRSWDICSELIY